MFKFLLKFSTAVVSKEKQCQHIKIGASAHGLTVQISCEATEGSTRAIIIAHAKGQHI